MERFNPAIHTNRKAYVHGNGKEDRAKDLRITSLLNSIFTEITVDACAQIRDLHAQGIYFPDSYMNEYILISKDLPSKMTYVYQARKMLNIRLPYKKPNKPYILAQTGHVMYELVKRAIDPSWHKISQENYDLLTQETYFGPRVDYTVLSGVQSILETLAILTAEIPEVYGDDRVSLYKDIISSGHLEYLAMMLPLGFLGTSVSSGRYLTKHFDNTRPITFSSQFRQELMNNKKKSLNKSGGPSRRSKGCPAAYRHTAIRADGGGSVIVEPSAVQLMAELLPPYFDYFSKHKV